MSNLIKAFLGLLLSVILLTGCSKSDDKKDDAGNGNNANVTGSATPAGDKTGDLTPQLGKDVDISNMDDETLKDYPEEKKYSMYYYSAKDLTDTVFFKEQDEGVDITGDPYIIRGIITEDYDDIDSYLDLNEHGQTLKGMDVTTKAFKVTTNYGDVILADVLPYQAKFFKDDAGKSVYQFQYYNCLFNNLSTYKTYPEVGTAGRFYGFYMGYDDANKCPVFTYGVADMAHAAMFKSDYEKYRTDKTKHYKYRNLIEFDYPVGWSEPFETGDEKDFYFGYGKGLFALQNFEVQDMSLDDAVEMLMNQYSNQMMGEYMPDDFDEGDIPEDFDMDEMMADMPTYKLYDHKYVTVGKDNDIRAHVFNICVGSNGYWQDQDVYLLQTKKTLVMIWFLDLSRRSYDVDGPEAPIPTDETMTPEIAIYEQEFQDMLKTITLCGY
jgi:hypothetical protein